MENAVEALKTAFAVIMFVMALSLSISSLSKARYAVESVIALNDRENEYTYIKPSDGLTRIVGVEDIVQTMYRAYEESFDIYFFEGTGAIGGEPNKLIIYYKTDNVGNRVKDELGNDIGINYINGSEIFGDTQQPINFLNQILENPEHVPDEDKEKLNTEDYGDGLYSFFAANKFEEKLGEYYINDSENTPDANKAKKRVITYTLIP